MYAGEIPSTKVKKPSGDNKRIRFLTHDEAEALLDTIREHSIDVYNISLLSFIQECARGKSSALPGETWTLRDVSLR